MPCLEMQPFLSTHSLKTYYARPGDITANGTEEVCVFMDHLRVKGAKQNKIKAKQNVSAG